MNKKFKFLTKESISKKINTKSFKITNLILFLVIIVIINLDTVVKLFGGDFNEPVNIYVVDEVGVYDEFKTIMDSSYLDALESYNASVTKSDKSLDELKQEIIDGETDDIILYITEPEKISYENVFDVEFISYEYVDTLLYTNIFSALNATKINKAMRIANISQELLNSVYKNVSIKRTMLSDSVKENEEFLEMVGVVVAYVFIIPIFFLVTMLVQMIGAEINEEKSSRSMEIIISSVPPKTHFMSKLISANVFALVQGGLLLLYGFIGSVIRFFTSGGITNVVNDVIGTNTGAINEVNGYIQLFIHSDIATRLVHGIPLFIILILLTFLGYSLFIGVLASVTTNMEDYNHIQTPVMIFLMLGYFLALYSTMFRGSIFIKIMAFVPFVSGILAPVSFILGELSVIGYIISILLMGIVCFLFYKYGLKVYKVGILNYSSSNLWKKIFKALKS